MNQPDTPDKDSHISDLGRALFGPQTGSKPGSGPWVPPTAEELQKMLPQYEVSRLLGRGGMGAVYQGRQISLDRPVAIKILSSQLEDSDLGFTERFKNEARAMAKLSHPGIVNVHDFGQTPDGLLYIVMEFIEGTDVQQMISANGRLHTDHAMAIAAHVCDALAYAHERGIIHRDIKPSNIMVGYDGSVKVADFGLAKIANGGSTAGLTMSGVAMGTMHYMAPESLIAGMTVDHRADIYAVGVMLYQMLTGKLPQGLFEMPSLQVAGLDPRYDAIISQAMRESREQRYQNISEMRQALDGILTRPVVKADPNQPAQPAAAVLPTRARPQRPGGQPFRAPQQQKPPPTVIVQKKSSPLLWVALLAITTVAVWLYFDRAEPAVTTTEAEVKPQAPPTVASAPTSTPNPTVPSPPSTTASLTKFTSGEPIAQDEGWISLFNGKDLSGWELHPASFPADVIDGAIRISGSSDIPTSGNMYFKGNGTMPKWTDFELICTAKTEFKGNSGIYIHARPGLAESNRADGVEVQIWNDLSKNGSVGKSGSLQSISPSPTTRFSDGEWFQVKTRVEGKRVQTWLKKPSETEWQSCVDWTQPTDWSPRTDRPGMKLGAGTISLQNNPPLDGVVWFKDIQFRELNKASSAASTTPSSNQTDTFNGHRYQFVPGTFSWPEAKTKAEGMGGHLATITSKQENDWLLTVFKTQLTQQATPTRPTMVWLGGIEEKAGAGWKWITGEPFQFTAWMQGEPNGEKGGRGQIGHPFMLNMYSSGKDIGWNDNSADPVLASKMSGFIVEWEPSSPSSPSAVASVDETKTFNGHRYQFVAGSLTWKEAKAKAESMGGHLACVTSAAENAWIVSTFASQAQAGKMFWIGASQEASSKPWRWVTGESFGFTQWGPSEPNNATAKTVKATPPYLLAYTSFAAGAAWNDLSEADTRWKDLMAGYLVEWEPSTTTISAASATNWIDTKGRSLTATFDSIQGDNVLLSIAGKVTPVAMNTLSAESQKIARDLEATRGTASGSAGDSGSADWLLGRWSRVMHGRTGTPDVHDFLPDHTVFLNSDEVLSMGEWKIVGRELLLTWPSGGVNHIPLPSAASTELDGSFASRDGKLSPFHLRKTAKIITGLVPTKSELEGKDFDFFWKRADDPSKSKLVTSRVLASDGTIKGVDPEYLRWLMRDGKLVVFGKNGKEVIHYDTFYRLDDTWIMQGRFFLINGITHVLRQKVSPTTAKATSTVDAGSGWTPLFPNDSLQDWKGDVGSCSVKEGIMTAGVGDLISKKEYGSFHLKFDLRLSSGGNNGIGIWCADNKGPYQFIGHTGFEIQMIDDNSPSFAKTTNPWQLHGALTYFIIPKAKPMGPVGSWNSHEIRMEGTKLTEIINGVTVIEQQLPTGAPIGGSRKHPLDLTRKRGHLVFMGMKGPVDFRNAMIKELP